MNPVDLCFLACVTLPLVWGLRHGVVGGMAGPAALLIAALVGVARGGELGAWLFPGDELAPLGGAAAAFLLAWASVRSLAWLVRRAIATGGLRWMDHLGGAVAGGLVGALVGLRLFGFGLALFERPPQVVQQSWLAGRLAGPEEGDAHEWPTLTPRRSGARSGREGLVAP